MADINASDIKLMASQRLDDTDQGGGQMTSNIIEDAQINALFPDISRLDRVYGRVSIRTGFASVQTNARQTYGGAHVIMTEQTSDPNVSCCFFSSENWFDVREDHQQRIEAYLVKGPLARLRLWGDHYKGSSALSFLCNPDYPTPDVGDVLVLLEESADIEQYVRITEINTELREFFYTSGTTTITYNKKVVDVSIGSQLEENITGEEVDRSLDVVSDLTKVYTTVAADASQYYGVAKLIEPAVENDLQFRVDNIMTKIVPSATSETSLNDVTVGNAVSPMVASNYNEGDTVTRSLTYKVNSAGRLFLGDGVYPGSLEFTGSPSFVDDSKGNIIAGGDKIGSISYPTGTITFGSDIPYDTSGTGTAKYIPAAEPTQTSQTASVQIQTSNRGFVYNKICYPIPQKGTMKVEYLAGGKWYTLWDQGNGQLSGLEGDISVGSGQVNFNTGTVSVTLGAMPDVDSDIIFYWAKPSHYINYEPETYNLRYKFSLNHEAIARHTFRFIWTGDAGGDGPAGEYCLMDDGNANIVQATWVDPNWVVVVTPEVLGNIKYATGLVDITLPASLANTGITSSENFTIEYNYGEKFEDVFNMPPRDENGLLNLSLTNTPILPGTFEIEWHTDLQEYEPESRIDMSIDPTYIFQDDTEGFFDGDVDDGTANWEKGSIDYTTGDVRFMPDRTGSFPIPQYDWVITEWMHPGVEQERVFVGIELYPAASIWPTDGTVICKYCSTDGANYVTYSGTITPTFIIHESKELDLMPDSIMISDGFNTYFDGSDGRLYKSDDGQDGTRLEVGRINYSNSTFTITSDSVDLSSLELLYASATSSIDPTMSLVFRTPGAPIRPGSLQVKGTTQTGTVIIGTADINGDITGSGILGYVNAATGLATVAFGEWVPDDATAQAAEWYTGAPNDGAGNVWKPYVVQAYTISITCVVTSTIPLDKDLIGLDPVRLPIDGKVPIFRDGYIVALQHTRQTDVNTDAWPLTLTVEKTESTPETNVDEIEVYELPTAYDLSEGILVTAKVIPEILNVDGVGYVRQYTPDMTAGSVTFPVGFETPVDDEGTHRHIAIRTTLEDMCLASDVQITGHISVTTPLRHSYPAAETTVSSVLPIGDMQSRAYNEFEQSSWNSIWEDYVQGAQPLASYDLVNYPITVFNASCTKERWLLLFTSTEQLSVAGENLGVLAENVNVITYGALPSWMASDGGNGIATGVFNYPDLATGVPCLVCGNRQFPGSPFWVMQLDGFGLGWSSGNCFRFNTDAANFPVTFIRTTLQAPATTDPNDSYTMQIRGDYS